MKKTIFSALLLLPLLMLSACRSALPGEEVMQNLINRSADLDSYHQFVALTTTTAKEDLNGATAVNEQYTTSDATLFPEEKSGYGKRIDKNSNYPATKSDFYVTPEVGYIRTDDTDWTAYATPDVPLATLQVYPLETFIELSQIIEEYGTLELDGDEYLLSFSGSDDALNKELNYLFQTLPTEQTDYEIAIHLDAESFYLTEFHYRSTAIHSDQKTTVTTELTGEFDLYNQAQKLKTVPDFNPAESIAETADSSF
ncbi:DUF6612 family protein [Trichococcus collinsii]|uniref:Lipoprotein n=1 Tax=Trichococcus collinsii TaxID=157076 RepID=A0AB38A2U6_9LACT|nr:DUF6612 family protein [Trichococcus collinsii]CZR00767.1 Hypothetical protein Tcol_1858 [Trichococcus collinsii]SEA82992.1 hypothetical protein SAMN04488525_10731 [Trichococcus collinsii]